MSRPQLVLVWDLDRSVSERSERRNRQQQRQAQTVPPQRKGTIALWIESNRGLLTVLGMFVAAGFFFGSWYMKSGLESSIARIEERMISLERIVHREQATNLGYKDPHIVPVALFPSSSQRVTSKVGEHVPYNIKITVKELTQDRITFLAEGIIGSNSFNNTISIPRRVGASTNLRYLHDFPEMPDTYIAILDLPTPDTAILAVEVRERP